MADRNPVIPPVTERAPDDAASADDATKRDLLQTATDAEEAGKRMMEQGRALTETGRAATDWAHAWRELAAAATPYAILKAPIVGTISNGLREFVNDAASVNVDLRRTSAIARNLFSSSTAIVAASTTFGEGWPLGERWIDYERGAKAIATIDTLLHRTTNVDAVRESLSAFRLGQGAPNDLGALSLLDSSERVLKSSGDADYAGSVLLPLREAIDSLLAELLRRRPENEPTKSDPDKVYSIVRQCGKRDLSRMEVSRVAELVPTVMRELSGSKRKPIDRGEAQRSFDLSVALIRDLVALIDPHRLRR